MLEKMRNLGSSFLGKSWYLDGNFGNVKESAVLYAKMSKTQKKWQMWQFASLELACRTMWHAWSENTRNVTPFKLHAFFRDVIFQEFRKFCPCKRMEKHIFQEISKHIQKFWPYWISLKSSLNFNNFLGAFVYSFFNALQCNFDQTLHSPFLRYAQ